MSPDLMFWLALGARMAVAAAFVVLASVLTERTGPLLGALIITLPISAGPTYVFLALDHDAQFIAQSALASLVVNASTGAFALSYAILAQTRGAAASLSAALGLWLGLSLITRSQAWTLAGAATLNVVVYAIYMLLARRFLDVPKPLMKRRAYDVPMRAVMVACLVATTVTVSHYLGPGITGIIAVFPTVFTSLIIILHPRIGGPATASVVAHGLPGLAGFGAALLVLQISAVPFGSVAALLLGLATSIAWNVALWLAQRYGFAFR
ncbi:MAG TPA: hypothetical protein VHN11_19990 [Xanthobacteraceae bacterium]|jgi:hypothetical protein|nr:hypothetical protein [Xanthobacteraceae bacterium]